MVDVVKHEAEIAWRAKAESLACSFRCNLRPLSEKDGMPTLPNADIRRHRSINLSRASALDGMIRTDGRPMGKDEAALRHSAYKIASGDRSERRKIERRKQRRESEANACGPTRTTSQAA